MKKKRKPTINAMLDIVEGEFGEEVKIEVKKMIKEKAKEKND